MWLTTCTFFFEGRVFSFWKIFLHLYSLAVSVCTVWTLVAGTSGRRVGHINMEMTGVVTMVKLQWKKRVQYCQVRVVSTNHSWVEKDLEIILKVCSQLCKSQTQLSVCFWHNAVLSFCSRFVGGKWGWGGIMEGRGSQAAVSGCNRLVFTKQLSMTVSSTTVGPVWTCGLTVRCTTRMLSVITNQLLFLEYLSLFDLNNRSNGTFQTLLLQLYYV